MLNKEDIIFNLGGVLNHDLYFKSLSISFNKPTGNLEKSINKKYGSFDNFYSKLKEEALKLKGSGYTFLVIDNLGNLEIINLSNQDFPLFYGYIPLINIDLWEHAYYLNYQNDRSKYLDNLKEVIDFTNASNIYNNIFKTID